MCKLSGNKTANTFRLIAASPLIVLICLIISCASTESIEDAKKAGAHYQIGVSYYNENKIQKAYIEFQKALELNPEDKEVLNAISCNSEITQRPLPISKKR